MSPVILRSHNSNVWSSSCDAGRPRGRRRRRRDTLSRVTVLTIRQLWTGVRPTAPPLDRWLIRSPLLNYHLRGVGPSGHRPGKIRLVADTKFLFIILRPTFSFADYFRCGRSSVDPSVGRIAANSIRQNREQRRLSRLDNLVSYLSGYYLQSVRARARARRSFSLVCVCSSAGSEARLRFFGYYT